MFPHKGVVLAKKLLPWQKHLYTQFESYLLKYAPYMFSMLSPSVLANKITTRFFISSTHNSVHFRLSKWHGKAHFIWIEDRRLSCGNSSWAHCSMRIILARWFLLSISKLNFYAEGWSENIWFDSEQHQHNRMSIVASVGGRFSPTENIHYLWIPMIDKLIDLCQEHRL